MERHIRKTYSHEEKKIVSFPRTPRSRSVKAYGEALLLASMRSEADKSLCDEELRTSGYDLVAPKVLEFLRENNKSSLSLKLRYQSKLAEHLINYALTEGRSHQHEEHRTGKKAVVLDLRPRLEAARRAHV
jgi:hypothetical protein